MDREADTPTSEAHDDEPASPDVATGDGPEATTTDDAPADVDAADDRDDEAERAGDLDEDESDDGLWALDADDPWPGMPPTAAGLAPPDRAPRLGDPGSWARRLVLIQVLLVVVGSAPWWALLYLDRDWEAAELAWFAAAGFGAAVALYGQRHRLSWVAAFGLVSSGLVLLLQMRGAGLLFSAGLGAFTGTLAAALALSGLLAMLAVREIGLVT